MINIVLALALIALIIWTAKKFYFPTELAEHPERYPAPTQQVTKYQLSVTLEQIRRWRQEGKISREEYDHLTDVCLSEIKHLYPDEPKE